MNQKTLHIAAIQLCSTICVQNNIHTSVDLIRAAANTNASIVVTPEMTSVINKQAGAVVSAACYEAEDPALKAYQRLAQELAITLVIGSLPIKVSDTQCANRCFVIAPNGDIAYRYDKIHMFDANLGKGDQYRESAEYKAGNKAVMANLNEAKLGLSICYDLRFPALYQTLAEAGANIICVPAAFTELTGKAHWHVLLRARAIETGAFIIAPAQGGLHEDGRRTYGHTMIINPWGEIVAEVTGEQKEGFISAEIDLEEVEKARYKLPNLQHSRPFTLNE
mgnify:CR=1 FL=1